MSDVFISYASSSRAVAAQLAAAVEKRGYSVWWDTELLPHDQYGLMIEHQLEAAKCVIVLWSDSARNSRWVLAEANRALGEGKLIQGNLSERLPPLPFDQIQAVRLDDWSGAEDHPGWLRIAASVDQLAGGKPPAALGLLSAARGLQRPASRIRNVPLGIVVAGVAALAVLPLVAGKILLSEAQAFLMTPLTGLAVLIVTVALLLLLRGASVRLRAGLTIVAIAGSLAAITAQAMLADRFVASGEWLDHPKLLGCGVPPETCKVLREAGMSCERPLAMCPMAGNNLPETVLSEYGNDPEVLYSPRGMARVRTWMQLAWNGLFLAFAALGSALLAPLLQPRREQ